MNEPWWESPCGFLCKYWWILLLVFLLALAAFFTRSLWLPAPAPTPSPTPNTGLVNVTVSQREVDLILRDNQSVDGDRITILVNGEVVKEDLTMNGTGTTVPITLKSGPNTVEVLALNEGSSSPNTVEVSISDVVSGPSLQISNGLLTGEKDGFTVEAP